MTYLEQGGLDNLDPWTRDNQPHGRPQLLLVGEGVAVALPSTTNGGVEVSLEIGWTHLGVRP